MSPDPVLATLKDALGYILADAGMTASDLKGMRSAILQARPLGDDSLLIPFDVAKALKTVRRAEREAEARA